LSYGQVVAPGGQRATNYLLTPRWTPQGVQVIRAFMGIAVLSRSFRATLSCSAQGKRTTN